MSSDQSDNQSPGPRTAPPPAGRLTHSEGTRETTAKDLALQSTSDSQAGTRPDGTGVSKSVFGLDRERAVRREELQTTLRRFWFGLSVGVVAWMAFGLNDWLVSRFIADVELSKMLALRGMGALFIAGALAYTRWRPPSSLPVLYGWAIAILATISATLAVISVEYQFIESPYLHGVSLLLVGEGLLIPKPWRYGLWTAASAVASYLVVTAVAPFAAPALSGWSPTAAALATFGQNLALVLSTAVFTVAGGHMVWALRRQVFESRTIGRYRLKERLGKGGMGEVWRAYHFALKRDVALKILRPSSEYGEVAVARFDREVAAMTSLMHPHTVRVYDYGVTPDGLWYYVMELLEGRTLRDVIDQEAPMAPSRAVKLALQACGALAEAHRKSIVHRDIKPENLFVLKLDDGTEHLKVLDFGIAKVTHGAQRTTLTREGWVGGTPAYISPEAGRGQVASYPADVYGMGLVLYYALTSRLPFVGHNPMMVVHAHLFHQPPPPSQFLEEPLDSKLERIVLKCLAKEAINRFENAQALASALMALPPLADEPGRMRIHEGPAVQPDGDTETSAPARAAAPIPNE